MTYQIQAFPDLWIDPAIILAGLFLVFLSLLFRRVWPLILAAPCLVWGGFGDRDITLLACCAAIVPSLWAMFSRRP